jgi:hypothetical protein
MDTICDKSDVHTTSNTLKIIFSFNCPGSWGFVLSICSGRKEGKIAMVVKKKFFVFIILAFVIMGTAIPSASAQKSSEEITKEAEKIARRDKMIAELKAEYAAKVAVKKAEKSAKVIKEISEVTEIITENKVEPSEVTASKITEAESIAAEKISDVKDIVEPVEPVSEHGTEEAESKEPLKNMQVLWQM